MLNEQRATNGATAICQHEEQGQSKRLPRHRPTQQMQLKLLAFIVSLVCVATLSSGWAQRGVLSCEELRAKVPEVGDLLKMTKTERHELKRFLVEHEAELKFCLGKKATVLKHWLK